MFLSTSRKLKSVFRYKEFTFFIGETIPNGRYALVTKSFIDVDEHSRDTSRIYLGIANTSDMTKKQIEVCDEGVVLLCAKLKVLLRGTKSIIHETRDKVSFSKQITQKLEQQTNRIVKTISDYIREVEECGSYPSTYMELFPEND